MYILTHLCIFLVILSYTHVYTHIRHLLTQNRQPLTTIIGQSGTHGANARQEGFSGIFKEAMEQTNKNALPGPPPS